LVIASLVLAACAPQATSQPVETVEPMATQAPTSTSQPAPTSQPSPTAEAEVPDTGNQNIVELAAADGRFTALVAAIQAAGLEETLQGEGPYTVFAPTDDAFAELPAGTVDALLADPEQLSNILLYHVIPGKVMAADAMALDGQEAPTALESQSLSISVRDGNVYLNDTAQVITADIEASNGVIHVIDAVLLPKADQSASMAEGQEMDIVDTAIADGRFTTLVTALEAAGLVETLKSEGPFTVFAPTDEAFAALPPGTVEGLLQDIPQLSNILLYHVVPGEVMAADVIALDGQQVETAYEGQSLSVSVRDGNVYLNDTVQVIVTDIQTSNGIIHVIDAVLLPAQ